MPPSPWTARRCGAGSDRRRHPLRIELGQFSLREYKQFLRDQAGEIAAFKAVQQQAFHDERERWRLAGQAENVAEADDAQPPDDGQALPAGARSVASPVPGSVWKLLMAEGAQVAAGDTLAVVESMKMDFAVAAPAAGRVWHLTRSVAYTDPSANSTGRSKTRREHRLLQRSIMPRHQPTIRVGRRTQSMGPPGPPSK